MWLVDKIFCRRKGGTCSGGSARSVKGADVRRGFTLVELLVVMVIIVIVSSAALIFLRSTAEHEARQQENLEQIQNLRAAFNTVARDVRMAGNGLGILGPTLVQIYVPAKDNSDMQDAAGWFRYSGVEDYGVRAIYGLDSGATLDKADALTIFRADVEAVNPMGRLRENFTPGSDSSITLLENLIAGEDMVSGDIIALSTGEVAVILQANLVGTTDVLTLGDRFKPGEEMKSPADFTFPAGTLVYNLKNVTFVTYYLDADNLQLMASYHGQVQGSSSPPVADVSVLASNIEDFQVNYYLAPPVSADPVPVTSLVWTDMTPPLGTNWVTGVKIGMVSRSAGNRNQGLGEPVELMGHTGSNAPGFARRMMVENIRLRNY